MADLRTGLERPDLAWLASGLGCAAGDFDNDGKTDLAVCLSDGVKLFHTRVTASLKS